ncbi:MAG: response regulator transcription factor [Eubacteriales bacterium]|nr:response regulator transcription factor [Eubacteriales bacterium]MDD3197985.1 response regulator transcription factor [Eubacteriales bacterium]MDD3504596.1 response regulator transcription factor [Eubacteriales bacterium]MDD4682977.1 response regulator transcription factor [Eubacteriales bacterium]
MERILIIEDEEKLARFVELELSYEGYEVEKAHDGRDGLLLATTRPFDLILLDILLPSLNGIEVLRRIRKISAVPVILLTARDAVVDKVTGLDAGAEDYLTKPFAIEELLARIRVALRKKTNGSSVVSSNELIAGDLSLDPEARLVKVHSVVIDLTKREFDLLEYLLRNKNIVISRDTLLQEIWGYDFAGGTNAVDVYIRYLRAKIEEPYEINLIHTVRGVGYVLKDE